MVSNLIKVATDNIGTELYISKYKNNLYLRDEGSNKFKIIKDQYDKPYKPDRTMKIDLNDLSTETTLKSVAIEKQKNGKYLLALREDSLTRYNGLRLSTEWEIIVINADGIVEPLEGRKVSHFNVDNEYKDKFRQSLQNSDLENPYKKIKEGGGPVITFSMKKFQSRKK